MVLERLTGGTCERPLPVYADLVEGLLLAHRVERERRQCSSPSSLAPAPGIHAYPDAGELRGRD